VHITQVLPSLCIHKENLKREIAAYRLFQNHKLMHDDSRYIS